MQVGAERASFQVDGCAGAGLGRDHDIAHVAFGQVPGQVVLRQVARRHVGWQRRRAGLAVERALDVRPVTPDAHDVRRPRRVLDRRDLARVDRLERIVYETHDAFVPEVEVAQVSPGRPLARRDVVQDLLHLRRELGVDELPELALKEVVGGERREGRHELLALLASVAARLDRVDDTRVSARTADALGLEELDERRLREARGRLRLVTFGRDALATQPVTRGEEGQWLVAVVERGLGIVGALHVGPEEAREEHAAARSPEGQLVRATPGRDPCRHELEARVRHLRCHGALPDEVVERRLDALQSVLLGGLHRRAGRPDGLVGLLRVARGALVLALALAEVIGAVTPRDGAPRRVQGLLREGGRVGAHVRYVAVLVQALRHAHGVARGEAELAAGFLLQGRGREGRRRRARLLALFQSGDPPGGRPGRCRELASPGLVEDDRVDARRQLGLQPAGVRVVVAPARDPHAAHVGEARVERRAEALQLGRQVPVRGADEAHAFAFAHDEEPHGHALHAPRAQLRRDLAP